jgi:MoxR-like ATPase
MALTVNSLPSLRQLRTRAKQLATTVPDLLAYFDNSMAMFRLHAGTTNVSSTATCVAALYEHGLWPEFESRLPPGSAPASERIRAALLNSEWTTAGLKDGNWFTAAFALRALHYLGAKETDARTRAEAGMPPTIGAFLDHALAVIKNRGAVAIGDFEPSAFLTYWVVRSLLEFRAANKKGVVQSLRPCFDWAVHLVWKQITYSHSNATSYCDYVDLAFGLALCCMQQRLSAEVSLTEDGSHLVPPEVIEHGVSLVFQQQREEGIWPKYRANFHFPTAGSNYVFSFEFLDALLREVPSRHLGENALVGLGKAIAWAERHRRHSPLPGWSSLSNPLEENERLTESWATATIHSFLHNLLWASGRHASSLVLTSLDVQSSSPDRSDWDSLLDSHVVLNAKAESLKDTLDENLLVPAEGVSKDDRQLRLERRSMILFGPPGTAKTTIARAIASRLGWPFVEVLPDGFLDAELGFPAIEIGASRLFEKLVELKRAVVFFDEMDELVRERQDNPEMRNRFLTTLMLPRIMSLYATKKVIIIVATNHIPSFDRAIKRPGRFDLSLQVRPPTVAARIARWKKFPALNALTDAQRDVFHTRVEGEKVTIERFLFDEYKRLTELVSKRVRAGEDVAVAFADAFHSLKDSITIAESELADQAGRSVIW